MGGVPVAFSHVVDNQELRACIAIYIWFKVLLIEISNEVGGFALITVSEEFCTLPRESDPPSGIDNGEESLIQQAIKRAFDKQRS